MSQQKVKVTEEFTRIRLLKPSFALYLLVAIFSLLVWVILLSIVISSDYFNVMLLLFLLAPLTVVQPLALTISKIAENRKAQPGIWFKADAEREIRRYGPLRASRLFGHKIGTGKVKPEKPR